MRGPRQQSTKGMLATTTGVLVCKKKYKASSSQALFT
jgi:hypothetical protein